jgi:hypothetical protein
MVPCDLYTMLKEGIGLDLIVVMNQRFILVSKLILSFLEGSTPWKIFFRHWI